MFVTGHKKPLTISIVIPAYNEERHIGLCLDSIASQDEMPDEVIVVNNNSTDRTEEVASRYPFVTVIDEKHQGIYFARDRGFNSVKSDIIGRIDAESVLPKNWVSYIKSFYEDEDHHNYAWTGAVYFDNIPLPKFNGWLTAQIAIRFNRFLLGHYVLIGSNMAMPRLMWEKVRDHTCKRVDVHEDLDLAIHVHQMGYKITYQATILVAVVMRRVRTHYSELWPNMMLWPRTLRVHHNMSWWLAWIGALLLFIGAPLVALADIVWSFFGWKGARVE